MSTHAVGALVLPVLIALAGAYFVADHALFALGAEHATGRVVEEGQYGPVGGQRRLVVAFEAGGVGHRFEARTGWKNTLGVGVGSPVGVMYRPEDPSRAVLDSWWRPLALPLLALGIGGWLAVRIAAERRG